MDARHFKATTGNIVGSQESMAQGFSGQSALVPSTQARAGIFTTGDRFLKTLNTSLGRGSWRYIDFLCVCVCGKASNKQLFWPGGQCRELIYCRLISGVEVYGREYSFGYSDDGGFHEPVGKRLCLKEEILNHEFAYGQL